MLLEDVIRAQLGQLFPGQTILESTVIRLARDAELELDDEGGRTHLEVVEREVRRAGAATWSGWRSRQASEELLALLREQLDSRRRRSTGPGTARPARAVRAHRAAPASTSCASRRCSRPACWPSTSRPTVRGPRRPRRAAAPPLRVLRPGDCASSRRPPTTRTCWRSSRRSTAPASARRSSRRCSAAGAQQAGDGAGRAHRALRRGAQHPVGAGAGAGGAHVIYGVRRYKTHAKICLVVGARRRAAALRAPRHRQLQRADGAGLHRLRPDDLVAGDRRRCDRVLQRADRLLGPAAPEEAGDGAHPPPAALPEADRARAPPRRGGQPAEIIAKMNSLIDEEIIAALYAASQAGVRDPAQRPRHLRAAAGRPGRQRQHRGDLDRRSLPRARAVYYFLNGGDEQVYLASADWMSRNLDKRVELMFPVDDTGHKSERAHALRAMFRDNVKARCLAPTEPTSGRNGARRGAAVPRPAAPAGRGPRAARRSPATARAYVLPEEADRNSVEEAGARKPAPPIRSFPIIWGPSNSSHD